MEAEMINAASSLSGSSRLEDTAYWKQHTELHHRSGLTKLDYCQQYQVHYHRFIYWSRKLSSDAQAALSPHPKDFISVQRKEPLLPVSSYPALCSLTLSLGLRLEIHDQQALGFILERLSWDVGLEYIDLVVSAAD